LPSDPLAQRAEGRCPICARRADRVGTKVGRWRNREYHLARCAACAFGFVMDPDTDFAQIYNADYYRGRGADPLVHYESEVGTPARSARAYELRGLVEYAGASIALSPKERWLDFGSGLGGFVTYLRSRGTEAYGYDEGFAADEARGRSVPMLTRDDLRNVAGTFGVVSAIEVLEHVLDPVETIRTIAQLLRPGGLFLYTTGNAAPFRRRLTQWSYVVPEIHISFYEPRTMKILFRSTGLIPLAPAQGAVLRGVIRYKIMKNLGVKRGSMADLFAPWPALAALAERRYQISAMVLATKSPAFAAAPSRSAANSRSCVHE
jgi:SAM-dependent methyltransferase